jgi:hypothetical protein
MHQSALPTSFQAETGLPKIWLTLFMSLLLPTSAKNHLTHFSQAAGPTSSPIPPSWCNFKEAEDNISTSEIFLQLTNITVSLKKLSESYSKEVSLAVQRVTIICIWYGMLLWRRQSVFFSTICYYYPFKTKGWKLF